MGQTAEHGAPQARQTGFTPRHGALDRDSTQNALSAPRGAADLAQGSDDADLTQSTATSCKYTWTASCIQHMPHCSVLCVHPFWQYVPGCVYPFLFSGPKGLWLGPKGFAYSGRYPTSPEPRIHRSNQVTLRCCDQRACSPKTGQHSLTPVSIFRALSCSHALFDNPSKI